MTPRVVLVNRFAWPDHSATSQMLSDLAFELAHAGHDVAIIASRQKYDDARAIMAAREVVDGVAIHRIWTSRFGRARLMGRALDYLTFYASAAVAVLRIARRGDVVIVKTDPPLLSVVAGPVARVRGAFVVNWWQDVFPEVAAALGVRGFGGMLGAVARALRNGSLRRATMNVAIGERMAKHLEAQGARQGRTVTIHNWADGDAVTPLESGTNRLRERWGLGGKFVVGYSGNLGRVHDWKTLVDAADRLRNDSNIVFLFIGGGHQLDAMRHAVESRGLEDRFVFRAYQRREELRESLGVPDVHWLSLRPELEGLVVPSKLYGILAAGRPVIMVGAPDGEVGAIIRAAECGLCIEQGDSAGLAATVQRFKDNAELRMCMGSSARRLLATRFEKAIAMEEWRRCLGQLGRKPGK